MELRWETRPSLAEWDDDNTVACLIGLRPAWMKRAACHGQTDLFFPDRDMNDQVKAAKQICLGCPVRHECRQYALGHPSERGIWGGWSERQRKDMRNGRA